jgi:hypothetical protein
VIIHPIFRDMERLGQYRTLDMQPILGVLFDMVKEESFNSSLM